MTAQTAAIDAPSHRPANPPVEDNRITLSGQLRSLLKRRIITLYCFGFFTLRQTQKLIDTFKLWEA